MSTDLSILLGRKERAGTDGSILFGQLAETLQGRSDRVEILDSGCIFVASHQLYPDEMRVAYLNQDIVVLCVVVVVYGSEKYSRQNLPAVKR